jgi:predicted DNA-binding transcriptional regulator YafY
VERFARLHKLLQFLGGGTARTREELLGHLGLDVRGFYRDLELLRSVGIGVALAQGRYAMEDNLEDTLARLPFPDPHLTLGEARHLAKGRTRASRRLQEEIDRLLS